jgi:hypothetical protein
MRLARLMNLLAFQVTHLVKESKSIAGEQSLGLEMLETLYSYYLLRTVSSEPEANDALINMRRMKFVQLLTNDIILRLCKFRDDNSMSASMALKTRSRNTSVSRTIWKTIAMPILLIFQSEIGIT